MICLLLTLADFVTNASCEYSITNSTNTICYYFNARSVLNKLLHINYIIPNYDFIFITETWLKPTVSNCSWILNPNFNVIRSDRKSGRKGGGIAILLNIKYFYTVVNTPSVSGIDMLCVDIIGPEAKPIHRFILVYRPPGANITNSIELLDILFSLSAVNYYINIIGDLNCPDVNWSSLTTTNGFGTCLLNFASETNLTQCINFPTRNNNFLDLLFSNYIITNIAPSDNMPGCDHLPFYFSINLHRHDIPLPRKRHFKDIDVESLCLDFLNDNIFMDNFLLCSMHPNYDINVAYKLLMDHLILLLNKWAPLRTINSSNSRLPLFIQNKLKYCQMLWSNKDTLSTSNSIKLKTAIKDLSRIFKSRMKHSQAKVISSNRTGFYDLFNQLKCANHNIPALIDGDSIFMTDGDKAEAFADYFRSNFSNSLCTLTQPSSHVLLQLPIITIAQVRKELKALKNSTGLNPDSIPQTFISKLADVIAPFVTTIINYSFANGTIPYIWKRSIVTPVLKKGNKNCITNYRPISICSPFSKIAERFIADELLMFGITNSIIPLNQHGFLPRRSTGTNLLESTYDWINNIENGEPTDVIYFDLSKAFDSVPHVKLINTLSSYGINGALLNWLTEFIMGRSFCVKVKNKLSLTHTIKSGVPQGSVLGPILFLYYIADFNNHCYGNDVNVNLFADDIKAYTKSKNHAELQLFINRVVSWCDLKNLKLSLEKCHVLHIKPRNPNHGYTINGTPLTSVNQVIDLGLHVSNSLSATTNVKLIVLKARSRLFQLLKFIKSNNVKMLTRMFKCYVRPILEFNSFVLQPFLKKDINSIESIQRLATLVFFKRSQPGIDPPTYNQRLLLFNLESLETRRARLATNAFNSFLNGKLQLSSKFVPKYRESKTRGQQSKVIIPFAATKLKYYSFYNRLCRHLSM